MTNRENTHDTTRLTPVLGGTSKCHGDARINGPLFGFILGTAIVYGLVSGAFYAFSSFVMPGLRELPAAQGIAAM